ncbi:MAG: RNA-binding protein [Nitrososphaerota archaeon]
MSTDLTVKVLDESLGKQVLIKLKNGRVVRGTLRGYDEHMNLLLEKSEELSEDGSGHPLGLIILRGDNVVLISPPQA